MLQLAAPFLSLLPAGVLAGVLAQGLAPGGIGPDSAAPRPASQEVRFGPVQPRSAAWTFRREASSWMRCQVWLDGRPTRDEILEYRETVEWTVQPHVDEERGPGWKLRYLEDQRRPSLRGLQVFAERDEASGLDFVGLDELGRARVALRPPPRNLVEDQQGLDRPAALAGYFAGKRFAPGDMAEVPPEELESLLLTRATRLDEAMLRFIEAVEVNGVPAARFELWACGLTREEAGVPRSSAVMRGWLVLRLSDAAPLEVEVLGRMELESSSEVELGARLDVQAEGESVLKAKWTADVD